MKGLICIPVFLVAFLNHLSAQLPPTRIKIYDGTSNIFPSDWLNGKIKATATVPDSGRIGMDTVVIHTAMDKYPASVFKGTLDEIHVLGKLRFSGEVFYGTNSFFDIFIATDNNNAIEKTFHHEFSSILLRRHPSYFSEAEWKKLSPGSLETTSAKALKKGYNSVGFEPELLELGYLDLYSLSNTENDFNMYAENVFAGDSTFWKAVDTYPIVKAKMELVVKFYSKVWNVFSEVYFRALMKKPI